MINYDANFNLGWINKERLCPVYKGGKGLANRYAVLNKNT